MFDKTPLPADSLTAALQPILYKAVENLDPDSPTSWNLHAAVIEPVERLLISLVMRKTRNNKVRAARMLGIHRNTLHKKIKDMGLDF